MELTQRQRRRYIIIGATLLLVVLSGLLIAIAARHQKQAPTTQQSAQSNQPATPSTQSEAQEFTNTSDDSSPQEEADETYVVTLHYPGGKQRTIEVDSEGGLLSYTDNVGIWWKFDPPDAKPGEEVSDADADLWHRFRANGTVIAGTEWHGSGSLRDDNSVELVSSEDGSVTIFDASGATINKDKDGEITMLQYPGGAARTISYADDSNDVILVEAASAQGVETNLKRFAGNDSDDDEYYYRYCRVNKGVCQPYGKRYDFELDDQGKITLTEEGDDGPITEYLLSGATVVTRKCK